MKHKIINALILMALLVCVSPANANFVVRSSIVGNTTHEALVSTPEDDAQINRILGKLINKSTHMSNLKVTYNTNHGVVDYIGTVHSDSQATLLIELAASIQGVTDVDTKNLHVQDGDKPFTDMVISAKVRGTLVREELLGETTIKAMNVKVETLNGIVYLTGYTDDKQKAQDAVDIIYKLVPGIKEVIYRQTDTPTIIIYHITTDY